MFFKNLKKKSINQSKKKYRTDNTLCAWQCCVDIPKWSTYTNILWYIHNNLNWLNYYKVKLICNIHL